MKSQSLSIRIAKDDEKLLDKLGGKTEGFETLRDFFLRNYDLFINQNIHEVKKISVNKIKRVE